jgi:hypothetical protein
LVLLLAAGPATAMTITDLDLTDLNIIVQTDEDDALNELLIIEDYNERRWIPYCGHDPYAIVNLQGGFFDKVVTFTDDDLDGSWALDFRVHNTTAWCWSDYHFEFWNEEFTERLPDFPLLDWSNEIFQNSAFPGPFCGEGVLEFWAPSLQCPCVTNQFVLIFDPRQVNNGDAGAFGIRQVATVVPEPLTMLGVFLGVSSLSAYMRTRAKGRG